MPNITDWAYLAALLIGEGCLTVSVSDKYHFRPCIKVEMCDQQVIEDIQRRFGGAVSRRNRTNRTTIIEPSFTWRPPVDNLLSILEHTVPLMVGKKRKQGEYLIVFMKELAKLRQAGKKRNNADLVHLLELAYNIRSFAGGANKDWKKRWNTKIKELYA